MLCADAFSVELNITMTKRRLTFPLIICDPPYGRITKEKWDNSPPTPGDWFELCASYAMANATICFWGGIGKPKDRPFVEFAAKLERNYPGWTIRDWITWSKKRGYGQPDRYLFTREECLIVTRGEPVFNVPLLDKLRGYPGYNPKFPAKSEYLRRTNVWTDITEIFRGKIHPTQKPDALYRVLIETHSAPFDTVFDPCAGSLTTARAAMQTGRGYVCVEQRQDYIDAGLPTLKATA